MSDLKYDGIIPDGPGKFEILAKDSAGLPLSVSIGERDLMILINKASALLVGDMLRGGGR